MKAALLLLAFLSFAIGLAVAGSVDEVSPMQVKREIGAAGAKAALYRYYDAPVWSTSIIPGISSAAPDWITVAEQFRSVSDAGASEDIGLALYRALAIDPFRVLPVLSRIYGGSFETLCNVSFEAEVPKQGVRPYLKSIRDKLASARTTKEKSMAVSCSKGLDLSLANSVAQGLK